MLFRYREQIVEGGLVEGADSEYGVYKADSSGVVASLLEKREGGLEVRC